MKYFVFLYPIELNWQFFYNFRINSIRIKIILTFSFQNLNVQGAGTFWLKSCLLMPSGVLNVHGKGSRFLDSFCFNFKLKKALNSCICHLIFEEVHLNFFTMYAFNLLHFFFFALEESSSWLFLFLWNCLISWYFGVGLCGNCSLARLDYHVMFLLNFVDIKFIEI